MNAQKARALAEGLNSERAKEQYEKIMKEIYKEAKDGKFKYHTYENLIPQVEAQLTNDKYDIKVTDDRNEILTTISW